MNTLLLLIIGVPALEILVLIKVGQNFGAINTVILIFLTAFIGVYYAKIEGLSTLRSGFISLHKNKTPIYDIFSGASIAVAACMLILPGFITDLIGFTLLFPFTRKFFINFLIQRNIRERKRFNSQTIDGEIIEDNKEKNDEL